MTILLADPRVHSVPVLDNGDPLAPVPFAPEVLVRSAVADRLVQARAALPSGVDLRLADGHRSETDQRAIIAAYTAELRLAYPIADDTELAELSSRFVSPVAVAPHVAGAAVDLTLTDADGRDLWMGTAIDATPEQSAGACWFDAPVDPEARYHRELLATALRGAGLVNYPTEWWHWSYGDRYWALLTGAGTALYGPVHR